MHSTKALGQITHVLFDMDGLILDTELMYTIAQCEFCTYLVFLYLRKISTFDFKLRSKVKLLEPYGLVFTSEVKSKMMGRKDVDAAQAMIDHYGLEGQMDPHQFIKDRHDILEQLFPTCQMMPGAERLLNHLHNHKIPMSLATASHQTQFELKTKRHLEIFQRVFDHIVTGDQVSKAKPDPEIFKLAAGKFIDSPQPEHVLVFEDAPLGVEAALRAEMKCVWVSDLPQEDNPVAHQHLKSLLYFEPELWGLPPFQC